MKIRTRTRRLALNAFCPTGKGGGVDPSCSPGKIAAGQNSRSLVTQAIHKEIGEYGKAGLTCGDINSGECHPFARRVIESVRASGGKADYGFPGVGPAHIWVVSDGHHFDAQHPEGVTHPSLLTFFQDNPEILEHSWKRSKNDPLVPRKASFTTNSARRRSPRPDLIDPTRLGLLRRSFAAKINAQFARLRLDLYDLVVTQDAFGIGADAKAGESLAVNLAKLASTQFNIDDPTVLRVVEELHARIDPSDLIEVEDKTHVTVRYGLHDSEDTASKVREIVKGFGPVLLTFGRLSLFQAEKHDVLKFEIESPRLHDLYALLGTLPNTTTFKDYRPHMTVAYLKVGTGFKYLGHSPLFGRDLWAGELVYSDVKRDESVATLNTHWRFATSSEKVAAFREWLKAQIKARLRGRTEEELWRLYIEQGFRKGAGRSFDDATRKDRAKGGGAEGKSLDFYEGGRTRFLQSAFAQPVAVEKVKLLVERIFTDLEGVSEDMALKVGRTLTDGLVQGKSPRVVARELAAATELPRTRALLVARTELSRAHAEGQLTALEQLGVEDIGVQVEWLTAGDGKVCPACRPLQGVVFKVSEARGILPRHPNCRCAWIPSGVFEDPKDQKTGARRRAAVAQSEKAGGPLGSTTNELTEFSRLLANAFCPTGLGGGVDPSCSPGGSKGSLSARFADAIARSKIDPVAVRYADLERMIDELRALPKKEQSAVVETAIGRPLRYREKPIESIREAIHGVRSMLERQEEGGFLPELKQELRELEEYKAIRNTVTEVNGV